MSHIPGLTSEEAGNLYTMSYGASYPLVYSAQVSARFFPLLSLLQWLTK